MKKTEIILTEEYRPDPEAVERGYKIAAEYLFKLYIQEVCKQSSTESDSPSSKD